MQRLAPSPFPSLPYNSLLGKTVAKLGTLTPLGTGGWMATSERETAGYLWEHNGKLILLDAGSGIRRLENPDLLKRFQGHEKIYLFLSHYHLDHVVGLTYLERFLLPSQTLVVCAPDRMLVYYDPEEAINKILCMPLYPRPLHFLPFHSEIRELHIGENSIDGIDVTVWPQKHSDGSIGFAFGNNLAYVTDTSVLNRALSSCNGVRWLLHEVYYDEQDVAELNSSNRSGQIGHHSIDTETAEFALQCAAGKLIPIHFHPGHSKARFDAQIVRLEDSGLDVVVPYDSIPISL